MMSVRLKNQLSLKKISQLLLGCLIVLSLVGCAKPPRYKVVKPSKAQLREDYIGLLEDHGVQVATQGETVKIIIPSAKLFNPRSANFSSHAQDTLDRLGGLLPLYDTSSIKIAGYSDDSGREKFLRLLTARQAQVVQDRLWPNGIGASLAYAEGYGSSYPISSNDSETGRELNRRIEIGLRYYRTLRPYD